MSLFEDSERRKFLKNLHKSRGATGKEIRKRFPGISKKDEQRIASNLSAFRRGVTRDSTPAIDEFFFASGKTGKTHWGIPIKDFTFTKKRVEKVPKKFMNSVVGMHDGKINKKTGKRNTLAFRSDIKKRYEGLCECILIKDSGDKKRGNTISHNLRINYKGKGGKKGIMQSMVTKHRTSYPDHNLQKIINVTEIEVKFV